MTRILTCGEALIGLTTAAASLPGVTTSSAYGSGLLLVGLLGILPAAYALAVSILSRVANEAPRFTFDNEELSD